MEIENEIKKEKEPETPDNTGDAGDGLDFLDEKTEEKPEPKVAETETETPAKPQPEQPARVLPPLTETEKRIRFYNAKMYTRLLSEGSLWLCEGVLRLRMKKEMAKVKAIDFDAMINALDDPNSTVLTAVERKKAEDVFQKMTNKASRLGFSESEESELNQAFADYMQITGKLVLDPGYTLALTILGIESKRISTLLL